MANKVVIFPEGKEAEAIAYAAFADAAWKTITGNPAAQWSYVRNDAYGQWVVPYLGPPQTWNDIEVEEPEGGEAARADGVLHDNAVWPVTDE